MLVNNKIKGKIKIELLRLKKKESIDGAYVINNLTYDKIK
jgi:hypothetical protein